MPVKTAKKTTGTGTRGSSKPSATDAELQEAVNTVAAEGGKVAASKVYELLRGPMGRAIGYSHGDKIKAMIAKLPEPKAQAKAPAAKAVKGTGTNEGGRATKAANKAKDFDAKKAAATATAAKKAGRPVQPADATPSVRKARVVEADKRTANRAKKVAASNAKRDVTPIPKQKVSRTQKRTAARADVA